MVTFTSKMLSSIREARIQDLCIREQPCFELQKLLFIPFVSDTHYSACICTTGLSVCSTENVQVI